MTSCQFCSSRFSITVLNWLIKLYKWNALTHEVRAMQRCRVTEGGPPLWVLLIYPLYPMPANT